MLLLPLFFYSRLHQLLSMAPNFFRLQIIPFVQRRLENGVGLELEIPVNYFFMEMQEL